MSVEIFIMNGYISKSFMTIKNYWLIIYRAGEAVVSTTNSYIKQELLKAFKSHLVEIR